MHPKSRRSYRRNRSASMLNWGWKTQVEELESRLFPSAMGVSPPAEWSSADDGTSYAPPNSIPVGQVALESAPEVTDVSDANPFSRAPTDALQVNFDDITQGQLDTCAVASVLSAITLVDGATLPGNLAVETGTAAASFVPRIGGDLTTYQVKLYKQNAQGAYIPVLVNVSFDGTLQPEDLRPGDDGEYWPALFQRAYLQLAEELGKNYRDSAFAFSTLTGVGADRFLATNGGITEARRIQAALDAGHPTVASSIDPPNLLLDSVFGIVHNHSYTVMGIEIPSSGDLAQTFVTVRNPWGRDTSWTFFDANHDDDLSWSEWVNTQYGVDGWNDGLIRLPWSSFKTLFDNVIISQRSGPSINQPLKVNNPPVFSTSTVGPFTIHEGERLEVDLNATDPDGLGLVYSLASGVPGTINLQTGTFVWAPPANTVGTYSITVIAEVSPFEKTSFTFQVNVTSGAPQTGSLTANPSIIGDGGVDQLTLTANNVTLAFDTVDRVEFWQDGNDNGTFEADADRFLGYGQQSGANWSWSGYIGGVEPGITKFFSRADWFSVSDLHYSNVVSKNVVINASPVIPPVATAGSTTLVTPSAAFDQYGRAIEADATGNLRMFWLSDKFVPINPGNPNIGNSQYAIHSRLFDASGVALGATQTLLDFNTTNSTFDAEVLPDGSFVVAWMQSVTGNELAIKAQRFTANGTAQGGVIDVVPTGAWAQNPLLEVAIDTSGDLLCVYNKGNYFDEDVWAVSVSAAGTVTRAPWQVNSNSNSEQKNPAVALNASGNGVIIWNDGDASKIKGRLVTNYGLSNGPVIEIATDSNVFDQIIDVAIDPVGNFTVSWEDNGVWARRFNSAGQPQAASFRVNTSQAGGRSSGLVSINGLGWTIITWTAFSQDTGPNPGSGVYAQLYDPSGTAVGPEFAVPSSLQNNQTASAVFIDADADVTVQWTDSVTSQTFDTVSIRQFTLNLAPTFPADPTFTLPENSPNGTVVGTVAATVPEGGATYSLVAGNLDDAFTINATTGQITVADEDVLNFEIESEYTLSIRVQDSQGGSDLATVTVQLTDVNEGPDLLDLSFSILENSPAGTLVGDAGTSIDQDEGDVILYSLLPGGDAALFTIDPRTGQIYVKAGTVLNFETKPSLSLTLKAQDSDGLSETATVFVNLINRLEPPVIIPSPEPVAFKKKNGPAALLPNVTLSQAEQLSNLALRGAKLVVSINRAAKKTKFFDTLTGFDAVSGIGQLLSQQEVGGRTVFTTLLSDTVTVAGVESYLRGLSFSTKGPGLKLTTRLLKVQLIGTDNTTGNLLERTITVLKK